MGSHRGGPDDQFEHILLEVFRGIEDGVLPLVLLIIVHPFNVRLVSGDLVAVFPRALVFAFRFIADLLQRKDGMGHPDVVDRGPGSVDGDLERSGEADRFGLRLFRSVLERDGVLAEKCERDGQDMHVVFLKKFSNRGSAFEDPDGAVGF